MAASGLTFDLTLDTSDFDRKIKRIKRQAVYARIWTHLWLAFYAAAMTGATITLAVIEATR